MNTDDDFLSQYADFAPVSEEIRITNDPEKREYSNLVTWCDKSIKLAKPKTGEPCCYRLVPFPDNRFSKQLRLHFNVGTSRISCACSIMNGESCLFCDHASELYALKLNKQAGKYSGKAYHALWVIDRARVEEGPLLWIVSDTVIKNIWSLITHPVTKKVLPVNSLFSGQDLFFVKRGKGENQDYAYPQDLRFDTEKTPLYEAKSLEELKNDLKAREWLDHIKLHTPLDPHLRYLTKEEQKNILSDSVGGEEDGEDGEDEFDHDKQGGGDKPINKSAWDTYKESQEKESAAKEEAKPLKQEPPKQEDQPAEKAAPPEQDPPKQEAPPEKPAESKVDRSQLLALLNKRNQQQQ